MKKFVLTYAYMTKEEIGYVKSPYKPLLVSNDMNTLMKSVENLAQRIFQENNPNFLEWDKWNVQLNASHAEIVVKQTNRDKDGIHFVIDEVDFILS